VGGKPHCYGSPSPLQPYTFGLLFRLGLYARWLDDAPAFPGQYADMLSSNIRPRVPLGARFGIDLADEAFWTASLDVLRADRRLLLRSVHQGEDVDAAVGDEQRVLELGGAAAVDVTVSGRPTALLEGAHGDHGLDGERHARLDHGGGPGRRSGICRSVWNRRRSRGPRGRTTVAVASACAWMARPISRIWRPGFTVAI
jgi:hypothetical protein